MKITEEEIAELAKAAQITLTDGEIADFAADLSALTELADALLAHPLQSTVSPVASEATDPMREDRVAACLPRELLLRSASACRDGYLAVPRALED